MRIIFLNCWFGKAGREFFEHIEKSFNTTDIFCFSEVQPDLHTKLGEIFINFSGRYDSDKKIETLGFVYGQSIFVNNKHNFQDTHKFDLYRNVSNDMGFAQNLDAAIGDKIVNITNVHGKALPGHKLDTPARIKQSELVINFLKDKNEPKIIGGDFNLLPGTKSIRMFEDAGYINLVKKFNIRDTRGGINRRLFDKNDRQYFADYCFVSKDIKILDFKVPNVEISDHLPLILDFEI